MFSLAILTDPDHDATVSVPGAELSATGPGRWQATWPQVPSSLVQVQSGDGSFSLWADEVDVAAPMVVRGHRIAVTTGDDYRTLDEITAALPPASHSTVLAALSATEDSYEAAAARNRQLDSPTWLGLGRDFRTFGLGFAGTGAGEQRERLWDWIQPQWHGEATALPGTERPARFQYMVGRGIGPQHDVERRLDGGTLPILQVVRRDGPITYRLTAFVTLERTPLAPGAVEGTPFLLADGHSAGHMFTPEQQREFDELGAGYAPAEETVLFVQVVAENTGAVPRHAFLTLPTPFVAGGHEPEPARLDPASGVAATAGGQGYLVASVDGAPAVRTELSPLVPAGSTVSFDFRVPHAPVPAERLVELGRRSFDEALEQCRGYWRDRLEQSGRIELPEQRLTEMVAAGLLHLDLVAYGTEPEGTLAPTIGVYAPIGSESAPIIQFFDSIGQTDVARRSLQYFIDKQHDDGFMQNFGGYMLETEAALWSFGEHYRYTRDVGWVKTVQPALEAAVGYILRNRRTQQQVGTEPHGLLVGKTADPEDPFAAYMLNGFGYLGLVRAAEMISEVDPGLGKQWAAEASSLRDDIRASLADAMAGSPLVPLADGTWSRTAPPWAGQPGPLTIDRSGSSWFTHGSITCRDALLGPLWLVAQEVLDPADPVTTELLEFSADLLFHDNTAFSQPYYSPHLLTHLRRGEVGAFLRAYYTMLTSLADPETYSFWEHYFHASPHKTHEEAWFLMQTRWMLYLEEGDRLRLLPGIPRRWLAAGQDIRLTNVRSYFGPVSLEVRSAGDTVEVSVECDPARAPKEIRLRLPHADGPRAASATVGAYDVDSETLVLPGRSTSVTLRFS